MSNGKRAHWGSRLGFILAASGSAIGLGNIVFFSASAYRGGGGAFYVPYLIALVVVGLPVLAAEFGLGRAAGGAFPQALGKYAGKTGEFFGYLTFCFDVITRHTTSLIKPPHIPSKLGCRNNRQHDSSLLDKGSRRTLLSPKICAVRKDD